MQLIKQEGNTMPEYIDGTIENDTIISTKGLYKILNKVRNRGLVLYNVQKQVQLSGGNNDEDDTNYDEVIESFPEEDRQGAKEFLTYQDDIDMANVERYGGNVIQELFKKRSPKSRKMTANDKLDIFTATDVQDFKSMSQAEEQFVKKYFKKEPQFMMSVRNTELATQTKTGGCDCVNNEGYEYALSQDDGMWKKFMEGGRMSFGVQKTKYNNVLENDNLEQMAAFKSVLKNKKRRGGEQPEPQAQPVAQPVAAQPVAQPVVTQPQSQPVIQQDDVLLAQEYSSSIESSDSQSDESSSDSQNVVTTRKILYNQYGDDWK